MSSKQELCQACNDITLQKLIECDIIYHLSREERLLSAATCPLCNHLLDGLRKAYAIEFSLTDNVDYPNSFDKIYTNLSRHEDGVGQIRDAFAATFSSAADKPET